MIEFPLQIPERSGEVLLVPRRAELLELARANRAALAAAGVQIAGAALGEWRARARAEALPLARRYTRGLGVEPPPDGDPGGLLLATGHQPVFPHPGIWVKYLLLDRLAGDGHTALAVIVDSDAMEAVGADVPTRPAAQLERRHETLRRVHPEEPYEAHRAPSAEEWESFLARLDRHLQAIREPQVRAPWEAFRRRPRPEVETFPAFLTAVRRRHEGARRFLDLPISTIAETEPFRAFFVHVAGDPAGFADVHNRHLSAYRAAQGIRTEAQPFPDLDVGTDRVELPFWSVADGRRRRLFISPRDRLLSTPERPLIPLPRDPAAPALAALALRPRAITLTSFLRVFLSDLFIHGVSGARYDRVTDAVLSEFLEIRPPAYAAASATLHLPFEGATDPAGERSALAQQIQEGRHNPERLLVDPTAEQKALVDEKWRLIRGLAAPGLTRAGRRDLTQRIRGINERLSAALSGSLAEMEAALAAYEEGRGPENVAT
ncbi:MAG: hypothetical protein ACRDF5_11460, partial [bacterium]